MTSTLRKRDLRRCCAEGEFSRGLGEDPGVKTTPGAPGNVQVERASASPLLFSALILPESTAFTHFALSITMRLRSYIVNVIATSVFMLRFWVVAT